VRGTPLIEAEVCSTPRVHAARPPHLSFEELELVRRAVREALSQLSDDFVELALPAFFQAPRTVTGSFGS
jgi:hypothetical protein